MSKAAKTKVKVPMQESVGTLKSEIKKDMKDEKSKPKDFSRLLKNMMPNPQQLLRDLVVPGHALQIVNEDSENKYWCWNAKNTQKLYFTDIDMHHLEAGLSIGTWTWSS